MTQRLPNYLKMRRKAMGLTQGQAALLIGIKNGSKVSLHERGSSQPSLMTALAYQAAYHLPVSELFAGLYDRVERGVEERARETARSLEQRAKGVRSSQTALQ